MITLSLALLALALAMDAFAAAVAQGAAGQHDWRSAMRTGAAFGLAQGIMPLAGFSLAVLLGRAFADWLAALDHWVALALLGAIGLGMIREGLSREEGEAPARLSGMALLAAAIATSIDAAIAGITLPAFETPVALSCLVIGLVTAALSILGVRLGRGLGTAMGQRAEVLGGLVLIGLGVKIAVEHHFFGG